jgi:DNA-binding MarR family transcriptional regulator
MPTQHFQSDSFLGRNSPGYLLKRAHLALIDQLEPVIEARGFTFTQYVVLMYLREGLVLSASVLCSQLRHDSGALTRIIDQLEGRGLVQRERSRTDRRSVLLRLSEAGRSTVEDMIPEVVQQLNTALGDFSHDELTELMRLLSKFIVVVEAATPNRSESAAEPDTLVAELASRGERS